ncbi:MAG: helix-turn-helix transcriptional regulator [Pseudomonadota bacterium]
MDDFSDSAATFGDRLVFAREGQGLTQAQLARRLGLKVATVQNWENDRSEPRANKVQMLAGFLNVSIVWLLTGEGDGSPSLSSTPEQAADSDMSAALAELRAIRLANQQLTERMGRVEKRLREMQHSG